MRKDAPFSDPGIEGSDNKLYVAGPISGCNYDSGTLYPEMRFSTKKDVKAGVALANAAYYYGYCQAQLDIRKALGINATMVK